MKPGAIVHIELPTDDPAMSAQFYQEVFGWSIQRDEGLDYTMFDSGPVGGGFTPVNEETGASRIRPGDILLYLASDDIEADMQQVEAAGGKPLIGRTEIPNTGWWAIFEDPSGNRIALYTSMNPGT
ncbi:MAG: VOC family protein [Anaerolineae bacterium]|nr:VOC family protein [Anaerolineae bacterium]